MTARICCAAPIMTRLQSSDCGGIIYDGSHNRARRWCDVEECGNLVKVRQFRARRRQLRGAETSTLKAALGEKEFAELIAGK